MSASRPDVPARDRSPRAAIAKLWDSERFRGTITTRFLAALALASIAVAIGGCGGSNSASSRTTAVAGGSNSASSGASATAGGLDPTPEGTTATVSAPEPRPDDNLPVGWVSTHARVLKHEALPCTGIKDPINFKIFSAGPSVAGLSLNDVTRRCDGAVPVYEQPANFTNYLYGECEIAAGATGCQLPLQIQSFPACQRSLADYSLEGQPLPYKALPRIGEAVAVEIDLMGEPRIEIYTGSTTIVIFATEAGKARQVLSQLRAQAEGSPPATRAGELDKDPEPSLPAPSEGAIEGELRCES